ncbi:hypothetical protein [Methanofollis formosanus]|uniref:hypothetical protein n=1 Tax=Methanofollis formosanus TaxID=299308 RepID=UPI001C7DA4B1|nr:hypothetical protein [Methanofollis formosanus]
MSEVPGLLRDREEDAREKGVAGIFNDPIKWFRFYLVAVSDLFLLYGCQIPLLRPSPAVFPSGWERRDGGWRPEGGAPGIAPLSGMHFSRIIICYFSFMCMKFILISKKHDIEAETNRNYHI